MESRRYPTDLSDDEWRFIGPHLPQPTGEGRPRLHGLRAILDAVFYVLRLNSSGSLRKGFRIPATPTATARPRAPPTVSPASPALVSHLLYRVAFSVLSSASQGSPNCSSSVCSAMTRINPKSVNSGLSSASCSGSVICPPKRVGELPST